LLRRVEPLEMVRLVCRAARFWIGSFNRAILTCLI
jgi:hypothetical protein